MSLPVSRMVTITSSNDTRCVPSPHNAIFAALIAFAAAIAFRSIHGICTNPPIGSHVNPRLCSIAISAAFSTCPGEPPITSANPAAAIDDAEPTSPWQPTSAPEIDACSLYNTPTAPAASRNFTTTSSRSCWDALSMPGA
ncbi:hypothetical protein PJL15_04513 [Paenarthrobacter nitroguajacolicus]|nr:hypothetical protein [Paenarthrobacter nitroguajacolicus]